LRASCDGYWFVFPISRSNHHSGCQRLPSDAQRPLEKGGCRPAIIRGGVRCPIDTSKPNRTTHHCREHHPGQDNPKSTTLSQSDSSRSPIRRNFVCRWVTWRHHPPLARENHQHAIRPTAVSMRSHTARTLAPSLMSSGTNPTRLYPSTTSNSDLARRFSLWGML
jgi:hypothetical protein